MGLARLILRDACFSGLLAGTQNLDCKMGPSPLSFFSPEVGFLCVTVLDVLKLVL